MPLKIAGVVLLALAGLAAGYLRAGRLYARRNFLRSFLSFLDTLSTGLRYSGEDIFTLMHQCGGFFEMNAADASKPFELAWADCIKPLTKRYSLHRQDEELLFSFGERLGKTDLEGQLSHIELYQTLFEKQEGNAEEDIGKKSKLYKALGLFVGVSAAIMLV